MSDDITTDELLSGFIKDVEKRISELEASSASHTENCDDRDHDKRIFELEKDVKAWADGQRIGAKEIAELRDWKLSKQLEVGGIWEEMAQFKTDFYDIHGDEHQLLMKQLNELKDKVESLKDVEQSRDNIKEEIAELRKINEQQQIDIDDHKHQLNELKEFDKGCQKWSMNIEEVLREFINEVGEYLGNDRLEYLLEKLDSQGKTEKIPPGFTKETWDIALKHIKDSGGEKVSEDFRKNGEKTLESPYYACGEPKNHKTDSKPPEPYSIFSDFIPIEGKWYHLKAEIKKDSANVFIDYIQVYGDEPREDEPLGVVEWPDNKNVDTAYKFPDTPPEKFYWKDGKVYVVVKREKIEFWRKELLNKTDEVLKSMREVLGIE